MIQDSQTHEPADASTAPHHGLRLGAIGMFSGTIATTLGIGGGVTNVPLMHFWARMPLNKAIGTSLPCVICVSGVGVAAEALQAPENIYWDYALLLLVGSVLGATVGVWLQSRTPEKILRALFVGLLLLAASKLSGMVSTSINGDAGLYEQLSSWLGTGPGGWSKVLLTALLVASGMIGGMAAALFGVGGGIIFVPVLATLFTDFAGDPHIARATSLATVLMTSCYATFLYYRKSHIRLKSVSRVMPTALVGAVTGVYIAHKLSGDALKTMFAGFLVLMAVRMLFSLKPGRSPPATPAK